MSDGETVEQIRENAYVQYFPKIPLLKGKQNYEACLRRKAKMKKYEFKYVESFQASVQGMIPKNPKR